MEKKKSCKPQVTGNIVPDVPAKKAKRASCKPQAVSAGESVSGEKRGGGLTKFRRALPGLVLLVCAVAFVAMVPLGNISAFGWESI